MAIHRCHAERQRTDTDHPHRRIPPHRERNGTQEQCLAILRRNPSGIFRQRIPRRTDGHLFATGPRPAARHHRHLPQLLRQRKQLLERQRGLWLHRSPSDGKRRNGNGQLRSTGHAEHAELETDGRNHADGRAAVLQQALLFALLGEFQRGGTCAKRERHLSGCHLATHAPPANPGLQRLCLLPLAALSGIGSLTRVGPPGADDMDAGQLEGRHALQAETTGNRQRRQIGPRLEERTPGKTLGRV